MRTRERQFRHRRSESDKPGTGKGKAIPTLADPRHVSLRRNTDLLKKCSFCTQFLRHVCACRNFAGKRSAPVLLPTSANRPTGRHHICRTGHPATCPTLLNNRSPAAPPERQAADKAQGDGCARQSHGSNLSRQTSSRVSGNGRTRCSVSTWPKEWRDPWG